MSFASIHFIFIFLPFILLLYYILRNRHWKNLVLFFGSLVFFAWADLAHLPVLIVSILINYFAGRFINRLKEKERDKQSRLAMWLVVFLNLLILIFYKYLGFFSEAIQSISHLQFNIKQQVLPLGISYFTFSSISYILDIYQGVEKPEKDILRFGSYIAMFPKMIQGPITRFKDVRKDLTTPTFNYGNIAQGIRRFIIGLAKKVLIANSLGVAASKVFNANFAKVGAGTAWFGLIAFTLTIYFDFSGYTDMALGLGKILGFDLPENFNFPYISRSITDFWRRWHMSLTSWFRTYVFIPLEFSRRKERCLRQQTNLLIVFLLTGLWHGANWNFIIWGLYFGLILAVESSGFGKLLKKIPRFFQHLYTMALVMFRMGFLRPDRHKDLGKFPGASLWQSWLDRLRTMRSLNILFYIPIALVAIILCLPLFERLKKRKPAHPVLQSVLLDLLYVGLFVLCVAYILSNGFQSFMYAQF